MLWPVCLAHEEVGLGSARRKPVPASIVRCLKEETPGKRWKRAPRPESARFCSSRLPRLRFVLLTEQLEPPPRQINSDVEEAETNPTHLGR